MTDLDLLREYARFGCQRAFGELVRRHVDMVYATCLRRLRHRQDAEDATQAVFIALAGKAADLGDKTVPGGWLYRAAGYICADMRRKAKRREGHEMAAAIEKAQNRPEREPDAQDIDDALARLDADDRDAIVLRFLEERSFRDVGVELRISEEAARKRVSRALQRLRGTLIAADGTALSLVAVESLLQACLHPAPPGASRGGHQSGIGRARGGFERRGISQRSGDDHGNDTHQIARRGRGPGAARQRGIGGLQDDGAADAAPDHGGRLAERAGHQRREPGLANALHRDLSTGARPDREVRRPRSRSRAAAILEEPAQQPGLSAHS